VILPCSWDAGRNSKRSCCRSPARRRLGRARGFAGRDFSRQFVCRESEAACSLRPWDRMVRLLPFVCPAHRVAPSPASAGR